MNKHNLLDKENKMNTYDSLERQRGGRETKMTLWRTGKKQKLFWRQRVKETETDFGERERKEQK